MSNQIDLHDRMAVITGGAQGIGRAIAERFVASGASVALWDRDDAHARATARELGRSAHAFAVDVADPASVDAAARATQDALGRVDILVNNAGIAGPTAKGWEYSIDELRETMRVNLEGPFNCCHALIPGMIARNYGRIVNIASIAGKEGNPNASAYSASKAALIALTKSLGKELATYDIAVNAIAPAVARTAILGQVTQEHIDYMVAKIPRGRMVDVEEIAALVAWADEWRLKYSRASATNFSAGNSSR